MTRILWLPLAAALASSVAIAQTTTNPPPGPAPAPPAPAAPTAQPATPPTAAQPASPPAGSTTTGSISTPDRTDANAPLKGANSFTQAQAKSRIEEKGFTQVSELKKDDDGIWRGTATQAGKQVEVMLDYRGNVVSR